MATWIDFNGGPAVYVPKEQRAKVIEVDPSYKYKPKRKGKPTMNYSTAVMLINPNIRAIKTIYKPDALRGDGKSQMNEPRVIYKTLDTTIKKGDLVVVETHTRHGMTAVLVEEVDIEVDFESDVVVRWVVDKVDTAGLKAIQAEEGKWIDALKASEKRRKREEIKKNMLAMYDDAGIEKLAIASIGAPPAIEAVPEENK